MKEHWHAYACSGPINTVLYLKSLSNTQKMSLVVFADKFRIKHPDVPEQFYGKLAKIENIRAQENTANLHRLNTPVLGANKLESSGMKVRTDQARIQEQKKWEGGPPNSTIKISLRRDSNST